MLKAKEIVLLRHAKSSWNDGTLEDFDRPLNERGINDIIKVKPLYEKLLQGNNSILCSPALRTTETAHGTCSYFGVDKGNIQFIKDLYLAELDDFIPIICKQNNAIDNLIIISHNYGLSNLAHYLIGDDEIGIIPTLGAVKIKFNTKNWKEISEGTGTLKEFLYPKMI